MLYSAFGCPSETTRQINNCQFYQIRDWQMCSKMKDLLAKTAGLETIFLFLAAKSKISCVGQI